MSQPNGNPTDEEATKTKFKTWVNEVLDERKAAEDAARKAEQDAKPKSLMSALFGD